MSEETIRRQDRGGMSGLPQVEPEANGGLGLVPCPEHPDTPAVDCVICEPVNSEYGPTTEDRYKAAVRAVKAAGIAVRINVDAATRGSITPAQLGIQDSAADRYAFTWAGQGNRVRWIDGEAYRADRYRRLGVGRRYVTPETLASAREKAIYWYHGGPDLDAARAVVDAFKAEGFEVEWDGDQYRSVIVKLPVPETDQ